MFGSKFSIKELEPQPPPWAGGELWGATPGTGLWKWGEQEQALEQRCPFLLLCLLETLVLYATQPKRDVRKDQLKGTMHWGNFGSTTGRYGVVFPWCAAQPTGSAWDSLPCDSVFGRGQPRRPPSVLGPCTGSTARVAVLMFSIWKHRGQLKWRPPSASSQQLQQRVSSWPGSSVFSLIRITYGWPRTPRESTFSHYLEVAAIVCLSSSAAQNGFLLLPASAVLCAFSGLWTTHGRKPFRSAALLQRDQLNEKCLFSKSFLLNKIPCSFLHPLPLLLLLFPSWGLEVTSACNIVFWSSLGRLSPLIFCTKMPLLINFLWTDLINPTFILCKL